MNFNLVAFWMHISNVTLAFRNDEGTSIKVPRGFSGEPVYRLVRRNKRHDFQMMSLH